MTRHFSRILALVAFSTFLVTPIARADVGPPVKIVMPVETAVPAVAGQEYVGTLEVRVGAAGTLDEFKLAGEFWEIQSLKPTAPIDTQAGDIISVAFRAIPADVSKPLRFQVDFNGRPVRKRLDLGPETFERAGKPGRVASVDAQGRAAPFHPVGGGESSTTAAGQSLHLFGRIAYQRPTSPSDGTLTTVGADGIWFEIMDDDSPGPFDDTISSGYTDPYGYFDVNVNWDDCDVFGCDDPDIYLRWETDNDVVNVQRSDLLEEDYSWSTQDNTIGDFTGSEVDFGTVMPGDPGQYPAMHIHNSIMHAYHYVLLNSGTGIDVEELDVQWPEDEGGSGAFYTPFYEEIHIAPSRQWNEDTHTHEYGHHFLENYSVNPEPDYENGICDTDVPGHCQWCQETDHDAWNEGWPNWLADVVTRFYPLGYGGYQPYTTRSQEMIQTTCSCCIPGNPCCAADTQPNDPFRTEGYAGALCRDIEDATQDDHDGDGVFDCDTDAMSMGPTQIFHIVTVDKPSTIIGFIAAFRARFPQLDQDMWSTVRNVSPQFSFPLPPPTVVSQTQGCKTYVEGDTLSLNVQGNGSLLRYQWRRDGVNSFDSATVSGSTSPTLVINPLSDGDSGNYDCVVQTCDGTLSVTSAPIRVQVFAARGGGTNAAAFGRNDIGQLGNGLPPWYSAPLSATPLDGLSGVVSVSGGDFFATALRSDGTVWAWGWGRSGELGSSSVYTSTPVQVSGISDVIAISSGGGGGFGHTLALKADGTVWAWGYNGYGELGVVPGGGGGTPIRVPDLDCVTSVAAGSFHSIASRSDGTVWTWGYNGDGERGNGTIGGWDHTRMQVPGLTDAVAVGAGGYHALVVRSNGTVAAWGRNTEGQLGDGTFITRGYPVLVANLTNVRFVTAGVFHSLSILDDGAVRVWGDNSSGQLGTGDFTRATLPIQPIGITSALDIAGGYYHTIILRPDRTVWGCGANGNGQLGTPSLNYFLTAVQIPSLQNVENVDAGDSQTFILSPGVGPAIHQQPANRTVTAGQQAQFSVAALGAQPFAYQWSRAGSDLVDGNGVSGANSATLTLNPTSGAMAGLYTVRIQNGFGQAISLSATLTVTCPVGDSNCDGFIDPQDAVDFADCLNGPGRPRPAECQEGAFAAFDVNHDNDVDLRDAAIFQRCFNGDGFLDPACANP